jgi:RecB family exonuclease
MPAQNIGEPYRVSNSELQTFKDCKRKWYFNYYRRLQPNKIRVSGPLKLGDRVHKALEVFYNGGDALAEYHRLMEEDRTVAAANWLDIDELNSEGDMGRIMLEGYFQWIQDEGIDAAYDVISNEQTLSMPLMNGEVELRGKLDMRVRRKSDGTRLIRDFKTVGQSFEQFSQTLHLNEQVKTYMILEAAHNKPGDRSDGAIFTLFKKNKQTARAKGPFYAQVEVLHNQFTLRSFWTSLNGTVNELMGVKKALDAKVDHHYVAQPRPSNDCTWKCPYYQICGMADDGSPIEDFIKDHYTVYDPNARYDEKKGNE